MIRHALAPSTPALSIQRKTLYLAVAATLSLPGSVVAADVALPRIDVVGDDAEARQRIPGAVDVVTQESLERAQPMSTEAALKSVPGVVIKPEEESAVVGNIGMRGLSAADYKTLIVEAPESAPGVALIRLTASTKLNTAP